MSYQLKCCECGKFISDNDYKSGKLKSKDIWAMFELQDVLYWCLKCSKSQPESEGE